LKLGFDEFTSEVEIISKMDAKHFRSEYINKFINTDSEHYKKYIEVVKQFSDRECYQGYLWDCLINPKSISIEEVVKFRAVLKKVIVFWDIHSQDRIFIPDYWKFGKDNILKLEFGELIDNLEYLLEDIYVFDETLKWTLALTHEDDNGERICMKSRSI
jgi:hypothetical protein